MISLTRDGTLTLLLALVASLGLPPTCRAAEAPAAAVTFFQEQVLPILQRHCYECHSHVAGKAKGGLVLDSRSGWELGGESGPAVIPGKPDASTLISAIRYDGMEMPPSGKLPADAIKVLERWVAEGAVDPRMAIAPGPRTGQIDLAAGRQHWAFRPLQPTAPPAVKNAAWAWTETDRFLLAKLESLGIEPVPDADRHTWLRRVSLDLTGLPPTTAELESFLADHSPSAAERVVDRLLDSRAYGERWARHWLDLVGYADQIGTANDIYAEHAWRYRDYVIDAIHHDKPFDQFVREQVAGDLLPAASPEQRATQLTATGFLVLGDLTIVEADKPKLRVDVVDQQVDKIGRAFLAMTLGCARCHDHKFDPISQQDYYGLAGILFSTESVGKAPWGIWSWPVEMELPEGESQEAARRVAAERTQQMIAVWKADRDQLRAGQAEVDATLASLAKEPESPAVVALKKVQQTNADRLRKLDAQIQHAEFFAPAIPRAFGVRDVAEPGDMRLTIRGNAYSLGDPVPRGFPAVMMAPDAPRPAMPSGQSGRRELADWLVSPQNPLTARVVVNRVWQKLFGEGFVRSVDYFGLPGEKPTHPELLDFLAQRFMAEGWSRKRLIKSLVLSHTYRLSSRDEQAAAAKLDPENHWLWRMPRRRMDAETLRDSLLLVTGRLVESTGGPSLPLEYQENSGALSRTGVNPPFFRLNRFRPDQYAVRTVYLPIIRSGPQAGPAEIRNYFDFTQPAEFAGQRPVTAVPTQALFLMNAPVMKELADELAQRTLASDSDDAKRLSKLWLRVYNRPPRMDELEDARAFLATGKEDSTFGEPPQRERQAWNELCHALLASNEFSLRQ